MQEKQSHWVFSARFTEDELSVVRLASQLMESFLMPPPPTHDAAEHTVAPHRPKTSSEGKTYQGINTKLFSDSPEFRCCVLSNSLQTFTAFSGPIYQVYPQFNL